MKIKPADVDSFARKPGHRFVLFYGPDHGRATQLGQICARALADDVISFHDDITKATTEIILSRAQAGRSLFDASHALRLRGVTDKSAAVIEQLLALGNLSVPIIVEAEDLKPASKLRKLFEGAKTAAACALYAPELRDLARRVRDSLGHEKIGIDNQTADYLASLLPSDTLAASSEIERFISWAKGRQKVGIEDIALAFSDRADFEASDLAYAVGNGKSDLVLRMMKRLSDETPVRLLRQTQWHFQRLLEARAAVDAGKSLATAMAELRPPVFFKQASAFHEQIARWDTRKIERALGRLTEAEQQAKSTGFPDQAAAGQCFLEISLMPKGEAR